MANCIFGWPIYSDVSTYASPTVTGGSWVGTLPITNVQDRRLARVARSTDTLLASTQFTFDLGSIRPVRLVVLILPNISVNGLVRIRSSNTIGDFAAPISDSGWIAAYPPGETEETLDTIKPTVIHIVDVSARYWFIEIDDRTNPDGYVDIARALVTDGWQPTLNMTNGGSIGYDTSTERILTDGSAALYNERPVRRLLDFDIQQLSDTESMLRGSDLIRRASISRQFFFVFDPEDSPALMIRRSFLTVLRALSAVEFVHYDANRVPFQLMEEI